MTPFTLDPEARQKLQEIILTATDPVVRRVRLILAYADGLQTLNAAQAAGISRGRARYWKREFSRRGLAIFTTLDELAEDKPEIDPPAEDLPWVAQAIEPVTISEERLPVDRVEKKGKRQGKKEKKFEIPPLPFPEPVKTPGILPNDTLAEAGKKVFLVQFAEMLWHESGTRLGEDIEALHDMRVATRRMRAAFDVFEDAFQKKTVNSYLSGLRHTGRLLGSVRDLDVFMEKANRYLDSLTDDTRHGLDPLLSMWQNQLTEARNKLIYHLDSQAYQEFKLGFNYFVQTPGFGSKRISENISIPIRVCEVAPCLIYSRLAAVRAYGTVLNIATIPQLHALRIEFKKLRYALEYFVEVLGSEARLVIDLIKKLQDHLGDLHDADVACQILNNFLDSWDRGQVGLQLSERQNPEPLVNYLAYQHAERHRLLVTFPEAWENFEQPETMRKVALAISIL
jgi:CHAD domain-containing protein